MALWTPAAITTALWLDAADADTITLNGSNVSQWDDKSGVGSGKEATQGTSSRQPLLDTASLNGLDTVSFDEDWLISSVSLSQPVSYFFVAKADGSSDSLREYLFDGINPTNRHVLAMSGTTGSSSAEPMSMWAGSSLNSGFVTGDNTWRQQLAVFNTSSSEAWVDGDQKGTGNVGTMNASDGIRIGGNFDASQDWLHGNIAEIIVIDSIVSQPDREKIEGYLAWKWGLEANLPADHPYKAAAPAAETPTGLIVALTSANSITWGWDG